jgi:hypothetical protein
VVVTHVEAVEGNRKHVMRLRIACVGSMNHLLDSVEPHHQLRGLGGLLMIFKMTKSSHGKFPLIEKLPPLFAGGCGHVGVQQMVHGAYTCYSQAHNMLAVALHRLYVRHHHTSLETLP